MDAPEPMKPNRVATRLPPRRVLRWCVVRTLDDLQWSAQRHRPITLPNLLRLFERRYCRAAGAAMMRDRCEAGRRVIERFYRRHQPFTDMADVDATREQAD